MYLEQSLTNSINCILFLQCQRFELCVNEMSQLFSSEALSLHKIRRSFLQELNS